MSPRAGNGVAAVTSERGRTPGEPKVRAWERGCAGTVPPARVATVEVLCLGRLVRVFLAGASGVIGQRLIPRLVQAGDVVGGMTRSASKTALLAQLGAEPIHAGVAGRAIGHRRHYRLIPATAVRLRYVVPPDALGKRLPTTPRG